MFAALVTDVEATNHWNVVVWIGLAFLLLQIALAARVYWRSRAHARILVKQWRDFERGGEGRAKLRSVPKNFTWLKWVQSVFPVRVASPLGRFTRADVLNELDVRIASASDYLLLQRLGVMAPLLGVILTVVGFFWLDVDESQDQSLQGILMSVTPLVIGVGVGAALAFVNQSLLHVVGGPIEALRLAARNWFDTVIWSNVGFDSPRASSDALAAVGRFTQALASSADQHVSTASRLEVATNSMDAAGVMFRGAIESLREEIDDIPHALRAVRDATTASARALEELIPIGIRAVSNLDVSVAAFRSTIDREFAGVAALHDEAGKSLAESVRQLRESTAALKTGADELQQSATTSSAAHRSVDESLRQHLAPGVQQFFDSAHALTCRVATWNQTISALSSQIESTTGELVRVTSSVRPAVETACAAVEQRVADAAAAHGEEVTLLAGSVATLRDTLDRFEANLRAAQHPHPSRVDFDRLIDALTRTAESTESLMDQLRDVVERSDESGELARSRTGLRAWLPGRPR